MSQHRSIFNCHVWLTEDRPQHSIFLIQNQSVFVFSAHKQELLFSAGFKEIKVTDCGTSLLLNDALRVCSLYLKQIQAELQGQTTEEQSFPVSINDKLFDLVIKPDFLYFYQNKVLFMKHEAISLKLQLLSSIVNVQSFAFSLCMFAVNDNAAEIYALLEFATSGVWKLCEAQSGGGYILSACKVGRKEDVQKRRDAGAFLAASKTAPRVVLESTLSESEKQYNSLFDSKQPTFAAASRLADSWSQRRTESNNNTQYMRRLQTANSESREQRVEQHEAALAYAAGLSENERKQWHKQTLRRFKQGLAARIDGKHCNLSFELIDGVYCSIQYMCQYVNNFKIENVFVLKKSSKSVTLLLDPLTAEITIHMRDFVWLIDGWESCQQILSNGESLADYV